MEIRRLSVVLVGADRSEDQAIGRWKKGDHCCKVAERARTWNSSGPVLFLDNGENENQRKGK